MDRLVDRDLGAERCGIAGARDDLPQRARVVVVGGGLVGASVAHHLALAGERDVLLLEGNVLGSGTSWHAAGLVSRGRGSVTLSELASYGVDCYAGLDELTGVDVSLHRCGSLAVARAPGRWDELQRQRTVVVQLGVEAHLVGPEEVRRLWPLAVTDGLVGGLHQPQDGHVNPGHAAVALAKAAYDGGVAVREGVRVERVLTADGVVTGVRTDRGDVEAEQVVLAAGLWTRELAATAHARVPLHPAEHVHARTAPIDGAGPDLPVLRDLDGYVYVRSESGRLLVGAFEPDGRPRPVSDVASDGFAEFAFDHDHFAGVRRLAEERVPALRGVAYDRFLNAPESFTPDGDFCLGETGEVPNLFVAAGLNSQGVIYAPGAGRALADWMLNGGPGFDAAPSTCSGSAASRTTAPTCASAPRESLGQLYAMHWPHRQPTPRVGARRTPLHDRLAAAGACFGETAGWERANWYGEPGQRPDVRVQLRPAELVRARRRRAPRRPRGGGAVRPELVHQGRGRRARRARACSRRSAPPRWTSAVGRVRSHAAAQPAGRHRAGRHGDPARRSTGSSSSRPPPARPRPVGPATGGPRPRGRRLRRHRRARDHGRHGPAQPRADGPDLARRLERRGPALLPGPRGRGRLRPRAGAAHQLRRRARLRDLPVGRPGRRDVRRGRARGRRPRAGARRLPRPRLAAVREGPSPPRPRHRPGHHPRRGRPGLRGVAPQAGRLRRTRRRRVGHSARWRTAFVLLDDPEPLLHHDEPISVGGHRSAG